MSISQGGHERMIEYDTNTMPGMSGSPVYNLNTGLIVGVHRAGYTSKTRNVGVLFG